MFLHNLKLAPIIEFLIEISPPMEGDGSRWKASFGNFVLPWKDVFIYLRNRC